MTQQQGPCLVQLLFPTSEPCLSSLYSHLHLRLSKALSEPYLLVVLIRKPVLASEAQAVAVSVL